VGTFNVPLQVPRDEAEGAAAAIQENRRSARTTKTPAPSAFSHTLDAFGQRLRWGLVILAILSPTGLIGVAACLLYVGFGVIHTVRVARSSQRPYRHWITLGGVSIAALYALIVGASLLTPNGLLGL
jgi:hypothetical protein